MDAQGHQFRGAAPVLVGGWKSRFGLSHTPPPVKRRGVTAAV